METVLVILSFRVSESDSRFFEQFGALSQRFQERELLAVEDRSGEEGGEGRREVSVTGTTPGLSWDNINYNNIFTFNQDLEKTQLERLYVEVLFTIENKLGSSCPQFTEMNTELLSYAKEAFGVNQKVHDHLMGVASGEKAPIVMLNVVVAEASGLEAKDANGYSDPYCMLGIRPSPSSHQVRGSYLLTCL